MTTFAINGLGRIGKLALRPLLERGAKIAFINDAVGDPKMHAHLLEFDSIHGRWPANFEADNNSITIDGTHIPVTSTRNLDELPLEGVDVVIDCTGAFKTETKLAPYFAAGVKKVVVSAPVEDGPTANIVYGVNDNNYDPETHRIITAASCTTNCLAPVVKVLLEGIGIRHGSITTIHDVTNTQTIVDRPASDLRRARSALTNLIPTTTGSATAITLIYPELKGKLNGHAVRVPLLNGSLTDCVFEMERETSVEEVNELFRLASVGSLKGILGYETRPLVSSDYTNDPRSCIIDALSTMVVNGTQLKVYAWYDNEWGYTNRLVDVAFMVGDSL
ncbi:ArsJ-associated glyceraldehyde-3-phosphate dehydrogenase [Falsihalocynthiibacter arcticus]|uniref:Glyceraldehyde-3-phosphate dehydrogenase n=1 Tax=Falsihalocynthiibacter arcticus TaxID=1579316 RepID=A0A126UX48_9RHOB|nr:ArsJ-associated glyceraldehyde-3-phosphate dehydrogenase [Falsihalocynthiibacter arcticus]AML50206.1 glyceraldehyde-3-phosphate dehydrogenase [Falsihalocynthiibacter arcticus]